MIWTVNVILSLREKSSGNKEHMFVNFPNHGCIIIIKYQCTLLIQLFLSHHHQHFQINCHNTKNHVLCECCIRRPGEVRELCKAMRWKRPTENWLWARLQGWCFTTRWACCASPLLWLSPEPSAWSSNKIHDRVKSPQINGTITVTGF